MCEQIHGKRKLRNLQPPPSQTVGDCGVGAWLRGIAGADCIALEGSEGRGAERCLTYLWRTGKLCMCHHLDKCALPVHDYGKWIPS
uniref:AT11167p n=1 Tax=Drosophila melanogaster TaxID=7227 RepID=B5X0L5_DROME|nr:AT11167p [Drosophila melanogaster]